MFINHRNFLKGNLKVVLGTVQGEYMKLKIVMIVTCCPFTI